MTQNRTPPTKAVDDADPSHSTMTERGPDGRAHKTVETEACESGPKADDDIPPRPSIMPTNPD